MLNLDTHIVVFMVEDTLSPRERRLIETTDCGISEMVIWEIAQLHNLNRIDVSLDHPTLRALVETLVVWPVNYRVCRRLPELDFSSDPVDEIVSLTSLAYGVPPLTFDQRILRSKVVPFAV